MGVVALRADRWIGWASGACAVHCLVSPALALALPALALGEMVERAALAALLPLAVWALWRGGRQHRRPLPILTGSAGLGCWAVALALPGLAHGATESLMIAGGLLTFAGLQWNARLREGCARGSCAARPAAKTEALTG